MGAVKGGPIKKIRIETPHEEELYQHFVRQKNQLSIQALRARKSCAQWKKKAMEVRGPMHITDAAMYGHAKVAIALQQALETTLLRPGAFGVLIYLDAHPGSSMREYNEWSNALVGKGNARSYYKPLIRKGFIRQISKGYDGTYDLTTEGKAFYEAVFKFIGHSVKNTIKDVPHVPVLKKVKKKK